MKRKNVHQEVQKTLESWDDLEKQSVDPFFMSRLETRWKEEQLESMKRSTGLRPIYAWAAVVVLIVINSFAVFNYLSADGVQNTMSDEELVATEYNLETYTFYEVNNQ